MKIWIFNNYNMLPEQGGLNRHFYFGKYLKKLGHEPFVFVGSHPHNSDVQLIEGGRPYCVLQEEPFPWVVIRTCKYGKSRKKQVLSMLEYYWNARKAARHFGEPDVILGSSAHPLAAVLAVRLGRKCGIRSVVEVRDLWPESIVAYGIAGAKNPVVVMLRQLEKWLYKRADAVVFTMEGAYDYIVEQGWEKEIPREKVYYINNGVDLELFWYNREHYQIEDEDLKDPNSFKIVYTGSIRKVNNLGLLLDVAKEIEDPRVKFLIWGDGDELSTLRRRAIDEHIENVVFKGRVEKRYIPFIVSQATWNFMHGTSNKLFRFGVSPNKMFDYFAAGKPLLMDIDAKYNPVKQFSCGLCGETKDEIIQNIQRALAMPEEEYQLLCNNTHKAAKEFDFKELTKKLIRVIEER